MKHAGSQTFFSHPHRSARVALALVLALAGTSLSGCNRRDQVAEAIQQADLNLSKLSMGGSAPAPSIVGQKKIYTDIVNTLKDVPESAPASQVASASILTARGHAGLGQLAAEDAARDESGFLGQVINARAVLDKWMSQNSVAAALELFDPAQDLANLDKQIAEKQEQVRSLSDEKQKLQSQVDDLNKQAGAAGDKAKGVRGAETQLRTQAQNVSAASRYDLIQKAAQQGRSADELEKQAALLKAQADKDAPGLTELQTRIDNLKTQQELLRQAKVDIQARADAGKATAAKAREEAAQAGKDLDALIKKLEATREALEQPTQEAVRDYTSAVREAQKAAHADADARTTGTLAAASFKESLGDALATKARSLNAYSALMQLVVSAQPPLPTLDAMQAKAKAVADEETKANNEAQQAYKEAMDLFEKAGGGPTVTAHTKHITDALKELTKKPEEAAPPAAAPAPAGEPKAGEKSAPVPSANAEPAKPEAGSTSTPPTAAPAAPAAPQPPKSAQPGD